MWQTVDCKGNTVKWYEAELIDNIKEICNWKIDCGVTNDNMNGYYEILDLIQENEK